MPTDGGVKISLRVTRFRPSNANITMFQNLKSGALRVDVTQTEPLADLKEVLAWSAAAALLPTDAAGKLPDLKNLQFDPGKAWGQIQQVPLTNGLGFWTV